VRLKEHKASQGLKNSRQSKAKLEEYKASQCKNKFKAMGGLKNIRPAKVRLTVIKAKGRRVYYKRKHSICAGNSKYHNYVGQKTISLSSL